MKKIFVFISLYFLNGCGTTTTTIPIDSTPFSGDKATLIIYSTGFGECRFPCMALPISGKVSFDHQFVGKITPETPLKLAIDSGKHDIYIESDNNGYNEVISQSFEKNKVYFLKTWFEAKRESVMSSQFSLLVKIKPTDKINNYTFR